MSEKYLHEMIDDIEVLIDEAKPARFSPGKIMIEKDVLMTVIEELRKQIPGEIERSHKIILNNLGRCQSEVTADDRSGSKRCRRIDRSE